MVSAPGATADDGGLLALLDQIGHYHKNAFAFIPELDVNAGFQLTKRLRLYVGYTLLWVSTVARAGEQIDPTINPSAFPLHNGNGPQSAPPARASTSQKTTSGPKA